MTGNCVYTDAADYTADVHSEELRRARKEHTCTECGDRVPPGDLYEHVSGLWDGSWHRFKTCARCLNIRADYFPHGWMYGDMVEDFYASFGFDYRDRLPADFAPCGKGLEALP